MTTTTPLLKTPTRTKLAKHKPVVRKLCELAAEFDQVGNFYGRFTGAHNNLLRDEADRCAAQLRLVASFVIQRVYTERQGYDWVRASWRVLTAIGRANIR